MKPIPKLEQPKFERRWLLFAGVAVLFILVAAVRWILDHPYGTHWDEALYFNEALADLHKLHSGSLRQLGSIVIGGDTWRPPAYRLLALPFLALFGFHTALARLVTLCCWGVSAWLIYLTTRRIASRAAGAFAVLAFCLAPEVLSDSIFFSTEGPLLLATSAMLYFLWGRSDGLERMGWIGLGLAIGLGVLSKATFVLIAFPVLGFAFVSERREPLGTQAKASFFKAGALAFIVAAPWWFKNIGPALRWARVASEQPRNSLGAPSLATWAKWFITVVVDLLGPCLSILIVFVVVVSLREIIISKRASLNGIQRTTLLACICGGLPLVALQLFGTNHNLRYLSPVIILLAITVGILSHATGQIRSRTALLLFGALAVVQLLMIGTPVAFPNNRAVDPGVVRGWLPLNPGIVNGSGPPWRTMVRFDQWDWKPLREITQSCGLEKPKIAFLGIGRSLNPPQILYPWFIAGASPSERNGFSDPLWLWRYEDGPLDWQKVMNLIGQSDVVLTAPGFVGQVTDRQDLDNRYNSEFAERLMRDTRFRGPIRLEMGRFKPVEVDVFVKTMLECHSAREEQAMR